MLEDDREGKLRLAALRRWRTPYEALRMATSDNASLLAMSWRRNLYDAPVGRVEPERLRRHA
jgi:hypothetical protein